MIKIRQNLRKIATIAICLAGSATMFAQETGVVINRVKWLTRNVDKPGTFVANPEDTGMFYQWNRKKAWPATGNVIGWDTTLLDYEEVLDNLFGSLTHKQNRKTIDSWEKVNDPSPAGWRVPTLNEIKSLLDTEKIKNELTTQNGVTGRKFTDKATGLSIFLLAAGIRDSNDGTLNATGATGVYWSSTDNDRTSACHSFFLKGFVNWLALYNRCGFSIRSVAD